MGAPPATGERSLWPGILIGIGLAGTLDEVVFHQLLHWHHFYDRSDRAAGLVSDGLFHLASTAALVAGVALALVANGRAVFRAGDGGAHPGRAGNDRLWAAVLVGAGGFNLYDGTVQHKLLRLHQIRPQAEDWLPYDLAWNGVSLALLALGLVVLRRSDATSHDHAGEQFA